MVWGWSALQPTAAPVVPAGESTSLATSTPAPTSTTPMAPVPSVATSEPSPSAAAPPQLIGLPHDGWKADDFVKQYGVFVTGDLSQTADGLVNDYSPCTWGQAVTPMPVRPAAWRTIGSDSGVTYREGIIVFDSEQDAIHAMDWLVQSTVGCPSASPYAAAVDPLEGDWAEGFLLKSWPRERGSYTVVHAIRQGSALAWNLEAGDGGPSEPKVTGEWADRLVGTLRQMAPEMCRYTAEGC